MRLKMRRLVRFSKKEKLAMLTVVAIVLIGGGARALFLGGSPAAPDCSEITLSNGLTAWYKLDGNTNDSSGNGHNGTNSGATLTSDAGNAQNCAYSFNGSSNYITVPSAYAPTNNILSISAWVKRASNSATGAIIGNYNQANNVGGYTVGIGTSPCLANQVKVTKFGVVDICIGSFPADTKWHSLIVVWSGSGVTDYIGGAADGTNSNSSNFVATTGPTEIGNLGGSGSTYWNGSIDDLRIYNRALTSSDIAALSGEYSTSQLDLDSGEKGLVGWWKLDGNGVDSTPYAGNGTPAGGPPAAADEHGASGKAMSFNGSSQYYSIPNSPNLQVTGSQTISMWLKPADFSARRNPFCKEYDAEFCITQETGGLLTYYYGTYGPYQSFRDDIALVTNTWTFVTIVRDLSAMKLTWYINGVQDNQVAATYAAAAARTSPVTIGKGYTFDYQGAIDDIRLYNRALSASEVSNLYNSYNSQVSLYSAGSSGGTNLGQGLVGDWPFNGNALDSTPYGDNGTLSGSTGGPTLTTDRLGAANSAYSFSDANNDQISMGSPAILNGANGFTYNIWLERTAVSTGSQWPEIMGSSNTHIYYGIRSQNYGSSMTFEYGTSPYDGLSGHYTNHGFCLGAFNMPFNEWHMLTVTYDGSTVNLYGDGSLCSSWPSITLNPSFGGMYIMDGGDFNGSADRPEVWDRPLSAAEVAQLYNSYN